MSIGSQIFSYMINYLPATLKELTGDTIESRMIERKMVQVFR